MPDAKVHPLGCHDSSVSTPEQAPEPGRHADANRGHYQACRTQSLSQSWQWFPHPYLARTLSILHSDLIGQAENALLRSPPICFAPAVGAWEGLLPLWRSTNLARVVEGHRSTRNPASTCQIGRAFQEGLVALLVDGFSLALLDGVHNAARPIASEAVGGQQKP